MSETERKNTLASNNSDRFFPLFPSGNDRGYPRLDLMNTKFEKMFFDVEKKVNNVVLNENIFNDDFDKFNVKIQDKIIREIYDKNFQAIPIKQASSSLDFDMSKQYMIAKVVRRNDKFNKNIKKIYKNM